MSQDFVPAAGRRSLTPAYDAAIALTMRERRFRAELVAEVAGHAPARVLEVGCGTGSLTTRLAAALPGAKIVGLDPDPEVLARARAKPGAESVEWQHGSATELPFADGAADAVVYSLVLHHLTDADKVRALGEAHRVLTTAGRLHIADWGRPGDPLMVLAFTALRAIDGFDRTRVHAEGRLCELVREAGFVDVVRHDRLRTGFGNLELLSARPATSAGG